jgi:ArsR family transcriptional regulator, arsenate/arsenite/antimonite-responsive transcriptional repressor
MDDLEIVPVLRALAQPTRLRMLRLLANAPAGMAAGEIAERLGVRQNTLSSHLAILERSGLIDGRRRGRNIVYAADVRRARRVGVHILIRLGGIAEARVVKFVPE